MRRWVVFRTPWFQIAEIVPKAIAARKAAGAAKPYYMVLRKAAVICLVFDPAGRVVMVGQYRPPLGRHTLEMPAGAIEAGEPPARAAAREILEETGYVCRRLIRVGACRLMLNREDVVEYFYIGLDARRAAGYRRIEHGAVRLVERKRLLAKIAAGKFEQTVALGGMYMAEKRFGVDLLRDGIRKIDARIL
jgi:ADP-ribose pyrophosphatase